MADIRGGRRPVAIIGTMSALITFAWVVSVFDRLGRSASSSGMAESPALFVAPVVSLVSIVGITWYLLTRRSRYRDSDDHPYVRCSNCGRSMLEEWRLCPYCGSRVEPPVTASGAERT